MVAGFQQQTAEDPTGRNPIVVLGAGINGAAVARELALAGTPVVVIDADDIACEIGRAHV